jgi:hypothetical protein
LARTCPGERPDLRCSSVQTLRTYLARFSSWFQGILISVSAFSAAKNGRFRLPILLLPRTMTFSSITQINTLSSQQGIEKSSHESSPTPCCLVRQGPQPSSSVEWEDDLTVPSRQGPPGCGVCSILVHYRPDPLQEWLLFVLRPSC